MKTIFTYAAFICSFFIACNSKSETLRNEERKQEKKKISKRDKSINKDNSYSDVFLDSLNVEKFIAEKQIPDSISRRIISFYNTRNYQYAWFSSNGLTEQALGFWNLHNYATYAGDTSLKDKALQKKMNKLLIDSNLVVSASNKSLINTELLLTQHFIKYSLGKYEKGYIKRKEMERFIPFKKEDVMKLADSIITKKHKDNKYFEDVNQSYKLLKEELKKYYQIAKNGGWTALPANAKQYKKGSPLIVTLKKRLQITGEMPLEDSSQALTDTLENGIKHIQQRFGYTLTGVITSSLIKDLNVTALQRVQQILINLNRMRWMPQEPDGKLILVNIPEFILHVFEGKNKVFDMAVVVGKEGNNTMMFTGKLSLVVFSPYWNVPQSIVKEEILPSMISNANYLIDENMEITGEENGLPVVRQLPGEKNSLGRVKFLFPNSFDIYFHDTPSKSLFSKDKRAYSHGCIRLSEPEKLAQYLLKDNSDWPPEKITEAMFSDTEQFVRIKDPVPVFITYYTAWVDENGLLNFRDDIYKRDAMVSKKMFN
jgi:murein L,D-transpeptidase YcbB/YkuD